MFKKKSLSSQPSKTDLAISLIGKRTDRAIYCIEHGAPLNFSIRQGQEIALSLPQFALKHLNFKDATKFIECFVKYGGQLSNVDRQKIEFEQVYQQPKVEKLKLQNDIQNFVQLIKSPNR